MKEEKQTLMEMLIGLLVSTLLVGGIGLLIADKKLSYILGVLFGSLVAVVVLLQMYHTLGKSVDMEGKRATRYSVTASIVRMAIMGASLVMGIVWPQWFNIVGILIGLLTLKLCAFIQPLIHKVMA